MDSRHFSGDGRSHGQADPQASPLIPTPDIPTWKIATSTLLAAIVALAVLFFFNKRKSASRKNALLLVGAPDAGKTAVLSTLIYGQTLPTHTSLQVNSSIITLPGSQKTIRLVDIPGHPRVRDQFREHLVDSKAISFVVDASTISRNGPAVAEHLHYILHAIASLPPSHALPSLVILAHKADLFKTINSSATTASEDLAINRVRTVLERELEKRRVSQSGGVSVEGLGTEDERSDIGGLECSGAAGGTFKFADWEGGDVTIVGTSVKPGKITRDEENEDEDGLLSFRKWLADSM